MGGFQGYLQADAFSGYDALFKPKKGATVPGAIVQVACRAHSRRKFYDARYSDPARAHEAINRIRQLYRIERRAKEANLNARATRALRQEEAKPLLDKLFEWMKTEQMAVLPKSPVGQALAYALSNETALRRYGDIGELAIDNNVAERALRGICVGRNNWIFAGSARGGRAAAIHYSLIASARRHGLDPFAYLRDLLTRIATHPHKDLDALLPDRWKPITPHV